MSERDEFDVYFEEQCLSAMVDRDVAREIWEDARKSPASGEQSDLLLDLAAKIKRDGYLDKATHDAICKAIEGSGDAWLLRKQAEAVERATLICSRDGIRPEVRTASCPVYALKDYAQRLRQQAAESEQ